MKFEIIEMANLHVPTIINLCTRQIPSAFISSADRRRQVKVFILAIKIIKTMMEVLRYFPILKITPPDSSMTESSDEKSLDMSSYDSVPLHHFQMRNI